jgi:ATP-dependent DNA helicase RecG
MTIDEMIEKGEGSALEFKENLKSEEGVLSTIIAFANTSGGRLIIGINDKTHHIVGVDNPHKQAEALANKIHDSIEPRILPNIEVIPYRNTHLISMEVYPSAYRPHFKRSEGKEHSTYIRIGSTTRRADKDLLRVIERSITRQSFDEEPCYAVSCEDIDFTVAAQLFEPHRTLQESDFLSLRVIEKNGNQMTPTVGGVILFGKNRLEHFPYAWIQAAVFKGTDKNDFLDKQDILSFFPYAIEEVLRFIKKNMRVGLKIDDARHEEVWEIPKVALREALINAIVHTDYSLGGAPIRVAMFEDRLEIENTALLPWGLNFDDLKAGVSKLRNPVIARILSELGFIEQWGSGIQRMMRACLESGLSEPEFEEINARIRVTFYKEKVSEEILDRTDGFILDVLNLCGPLSAHQITGAMTLSKRTILNRLSGLIDRGKIVEISQGLNDPKKKYKYVGEKHEMVIKTFTDDFHSRFIAQIFLGEDILNLTFKGDIVKDYFYDSTLQGWENVALAKLKDHVVSNPTFHTLILKILAYKEIQDSFKRNLVANYIVQPQDFGGRDYRQS